MRKGFIISLGGLVLAFVGCAHSAMRGSVAMKVSDREGHVLMGEKEVKVGTPVAFFENVCRDVGSREVSRQTCRKVKIGEGQITQTLNEHYSVVRAKPGVKLEENLIVETIKGKSARAE